MGVRVSRNGPFSTNDFSMVVIKTNRTKSRTTLTTTHVNGGALLLAVDLRVITFVPYGPSIKKPTGKVMIHRVSTLNNRVNRGVSGACIRVQVLGAKGNPTIHTLQTRTSGRTCRQTVGRAVRRAPGLALQRTAISRLIIRSNIYGKIVAGAKTHCFTGTIMLTAKATTHNGVVVNRLVCRSNPGGARSTAGLSRGLRRLNFSLRQFGAKAPPHVGNGAVSCSIARRRPNSRGPRRFDFSAPSDRCVTIASRVSY